MRWWSQWDSEWDGLLSFSTEVVILPVLFSSRETAVRLVIFVLGCAAAKPPRQSRAGLNILVFHFHFHFHFYFYFISSSLLDLSLFAIPICASKIFHCPLRVPTVLRSRYPCVLPTFLRHLFFGLPTPTPPLFSRSIHRNHGELH